MKNDKGYKYIILFLLIWTVPYFLSNIINYGRGSYNLALSLDSVIPFIPFFVLFYVLYFPLVLLPFILFYKNLNLLKKIVYSNITIIVISHIFFLIFPASILRPEIIGTSFIDLLINLIHTLDNPVNLFPSLHISMSLLSFLILFKFKRNLALYLSIFYVLSIISTLFVKQHYVLDVVTGLILGLIVYFIYFKKEK